MENQGTITLSYLRPDGKRERTKLENHSVVEARIVAQWTLQVAHGLYTEAEICTDSGWSETVQKPEPVDPTSKLCSILIH